MFKSSPTLRQSLPPAVLIVALGVLAAVLRFAYLAQRGLFFWDEAKFALEGIRMENLLRFALGMHASVADGKPVGSAKPGHALLVGLGYIVTGVHDYTPLLVNASSSVAACLLVSALGWRIFGSVTGIVAGSLLAVSEYDVLYARSGLSESDATLLFVLGVAIWLWPLPSVGTPCTAGRLVLAGATLGASFSVNYRLIVYVAVVIALDLGWASRYEGAAVAARRVGLWTPGLSLVPLLWLLAGAVAAGHGTLIFFNEITAQPASYAAEVIYQLHQGKQSVLHFSPLIYAAWYVNRDGPAVSLLVTLGLLWAVIRPSYSRTVAAALIVVPYALYTFAPFIVPRNLVAALPFTALLAAEGLVRTARWRPPAGRPLLGIIPAALALAVIGVSMSWRLTEERSGFASAAAAVERRGGRALTSSEVMVFYLREPGGRCSSPPIPLRLDVLSADIRAGYRLAVLERHHNSPITDLIHRKGRLIASWPVFGGPDLGESPVASENGTWPNPNERRETVYLFDISNIGVRSADHARPQGCTLRVPT